MRWASWAFCASARRSRMLLMTPNLAPDHHIGHAQRSPATDGCGSDVMRQSGAVPVEEPRTTSWVGSTRAGGSVRRACACWTSASTARAPASSVRSARVVRVGLQKSAPKMLSKPTTLTSPGTSHPALGEPAQHPDREHVVVRDHGGRPGRQHRVRRGRTAGRGWGRSGPNRVAARSRAPRRPRAGQPTAARPTTTPAGPPRKTKDRWPCEARWSTICRVPVS